MIENEECAERMSFSFDSKDFVFGVHGPDDVRLIDFNELGRYVDSALFRKFRGSLFAVGDPMGEGQSDVEVFGQYQVWQIGERAMNVSVAAVPTSLGHMDPAFRG